MKRNRLFYVAGMVVGLAGALMLIPQARETTVALVTALGERVRRAIAEGKEAKRRREHQLEEEVLGLTEPGSEEHEAPDYIV